MKDEADDIIRALALQPHPEGGYYREMYRDSGNVAGRSVSTAIYFLLSRQATTRWHRTDATEIWHYYRGGTIELTYKTQTGETVSGHLGNRIEDGQRPQIVIPAGSWQRARTEASYALAGCTVAPGFEFATFEIAPAGLLPD